jgi:carbamate kinase
MRVVVALGGNALLSSRAGTGTTQQARITRAVDGLVAVAHSHELVVTHGNGPQIGVLALQSATVPALLPAELDVLGAESEGLLGYLLQLELTNRLPDRDVATLLTLVEVDPDDEAFAHPTKPVGMVLDSHDRSMARRRGWAVARSGSEYRRVVASPSPLRLVAPGPLRQLVDAGTVVICGGGGGIPVADRGHGLAGIDAVVDKDATSALVARAVDADVLVLATDVDAVYRDWPTDDAVALRHLTPELAATEAFAAGSMGPKVDAATAFAVATGRRAVIGALDAIPELVRGLTGTIVESS